MPINSSESALIFPDYLAEWPWSRKLNTHHLHTEAESTTWFRNIIASTPNMPQRIQRAFDLADCSLLASLTYPLENKDVLLVGNKLMIWFMLFDEYSDVATPSKAEQMAAIAMDAIRNPDKMRSAGECFFGEATRQLWKSILKCGASTRAHRRFIEALDKFTASVVQQAQDRAQNRIRNIDDFLPVRRETVGAWPAFAALELGLNLPDEVFEDPVIQRLATACVDLILLSNDMYSYNAEQFRGDGGHNIVTILMHHENLDVNEAMRWIGDYCSRIVHNFLDDLNYVPSFGEELDGEVKHYLNGLAYWVRGNDCWSFECRRYFPANGLEIQQNRKVVLLSRVNT